MNLETLIDSRNAEFIQWAKEQLKDLSPYETESLEWLMMEHYQFSYANTKFLFRAAEITRDFDSDAVSKELTRNYDEESGHAVMYKAALKKVGSDVDERKEFHPTSAFLKSIGELVERSPSSVLGTMFATETAAIFEHEVFRDISLEVIKRRSLEAKGKPLVGFHDMHLGGVEQSHKDELGIFLRGLPVDEAVVAKLGERPTIYPQQVKAGAMAAIDSMKQWWGEMFAKVQARTPAIAASSS